MASSKVIICILSLSYVTCTSVFINFLAFYFFGKSFFGLQQASIWYKLMHKFTLCLHLSKMVTFITELSVAASFDAIYPYARSITTSSSGTTGDLHEEHKYLFSNDS